MSKIAQSRGFLFGWSIQPIKEITSLANSIRHSFKKELKNTGTKKLNNDILLDARRNIIRKKIENRISSITGLGTTLTNNEIKDIMKVIQSLEIREILLKGTTRNVTTQEEYLLH